MKEVYVEAREDEGKEEEEPGAAAAAESDESEGDSDDDKEAAKSWNRQIYSSEKDASGKQMQDDAFNDEVVDDDTLEEEEKESGEEVEHVEYETVDSAEKAQEDEFTWKEEELNSRVQHVLNSHRWITDYSYDSKNSLQCRLTLAVI